jgi:hypothetical protein
MEAESAAPISRNGIVEAEIGRRHDPFRLAERRIEIDAFCGRLGKDRSFDLVPQRQQLSLDPLACIVSELRGAQPQYASLDDRQMLGQ